MVVDYIPCPRSSSSPLNRTEYWLPGPTASCPSTSAETRACGNRRLPAWELVEKRPWAADELVPRTNSRLKCWV